MDSIGVVRWLCEDFYCDCEFCESFGVPEGRHERFMGSLVDSAVYYVSSEVYFGDNGGVGGVVYWVNYTGMRPDGVYVNETVFEGSEAELGVWFAKLTREADGPLSVSIQA